MSFQQINYETVDAIVEGSTSLADAVEILCDAYYETGRAELVYAYLVHLHGRARNDVVFAVSRSDRLEKSFYAVGGPATDFVVTDIENIHEPFSVDIESLVTQVNDTGDLRQKFVSDIYNDGHRTVWVSPIKGPGFVGYGVLNHALREPGADPAIAPQDLTLMGYHFHQALRRHGLLAKQFQLTAKESETLKLVAQGRSAEDIADRFGLSQRAVELRLESARKKLKSQNAAEAIFKASAYGALI